MYSEKRGILYVWWIISKKYKYERLIKDLNAVNTRLKTCYSNIIICKKNIYNNIRIEDDYYKNKEFEKIINDIEKNLDIINNVVIPAARDEYNNVLLEITKI